MFLAKKPWWICALALVSPLLAGIATDTIATDPNMVAWFDLFVASAIMAAGATGFAIITASFSLGRRLGLLALIWLMLLLEVGGTLLWLLRGLH
jgi:hypothetical protein